MFEPKCHSFLFHLPLCYLELKHKQYAEYYQKFNKYACRAFIIQTNRLRSNFASPCLLLVLKARPRHDSRFLQRVFWLLVAQNKRTLDDNSCLSHLVRDVVTQHLLVSHEHCVTRLCITVWVLSRVLVCVCEWDRKMMVESRCLLLLCNFHSHSVLLCLCVCVFISRQRAGSPGQGQDRLQWSIRHHPSWKNQKKNKDYLRQPEPRLGGKI